MCVCVCVLGFIHDRPEGSSTFAGMRVSSRSLVDAEGYSPTAVA